MSSDNWEKFKNQKEEEWITHLENDWETLIHTDWKKEKGLRFENDWHDLRPCIDFDFIIFDVSLLCFYLLPHNKIAGFQILGIGLEWSW